MNTWRIEPNEDGFGWFAVVVGPLGGQLYRRWHASRPIAEEDAIRYAMSNPIKERTSWKASVAAAVCVQPCKMTP